MPAVLSPRRAASVHERIAPPVFFAIILPLLAITAVAGVAVSSTPITWPTVVEVLARKVLPNGWADPSDVTRTSSGQPAFVFTKHPGPRRPLSSARVVT
jgi:hypothetical protein